VSDISPELPPDGADENEEPLMCLR
jgi:hypothetical protein